MRYLAGKDNKGRGALLFVCGDVFAHRARLDRIAHKDSHLDVHRAPMQVDRGVLLLGHLGDHLRGFRIEGLEVRVKGFVLFQNTLITLALRVSGVSVFRARRFGLGFRV